MVGKMVRKTVRWWEVAGFFVAATLVAGGGIAVAGSASAMPVPQTGNGHLTLTADTFPLGDHNIAPGGAVRWQLSAEMNESGTADLYFAVAGHGAMAQDPAGLTLDVEWCPTEWNVPADVTIAASCPGGGASTVVATTPVASLPSSNRRVGMLTTGVPSHLLVTAALPLSASSRFVNDSGDVTLTFQAAGDTQTVALGDPKHLASTGSLITGPALLAAGLLLFGMLFSVIRRRAAVR